MTFIFGNNLEGLHILADKNLDRKQGVGTASARPFAIPGSRQAQTPTTAAANGTDDGQPMGSPDGTRAIPENFLQGGGRFWRKKKPRSNKLCVFYRGQVQAICANLIAR
jgi:hypothetical protein